MATTIPSGNRRGETEAAAGFIASPQLAVRSTRLPLGLPREAGHQLTGHL